MSKEKKLFIFLGACPNTLISWTKKARSMDKHVLAEASVASSNNGKCAGHKKCNVKHMGHKRKKNSCINNQMHVEARSSKRTFSSRGSRDKQ